MSKKGKIAIFGVFIIIISVVFWVYRHPQIRYEEKGKLKSNNLVVMSGIFNCVPKDIQVGLLEWQDTLTEKYYEYYECYSDFEVYYDTQIGDSKTVIMFEGEGILKETGEKRKISDTVKLDFEVYEVE